MISGSGDRADAPAPFEDFLAAGLGEEPNGMTLSVLSALARLNLDPYREAARLAAMPRRDAAASLTRIIARLHHKGASVDNTRIASLIKLLPKPKPQTDSRQTIVRPFGPMRLRHAQIGVIVVLAAAVLYLYAMAPPPSAQDQPPRLPVAGER